jgi:putative DNA primase/helicase
LLSTDPVQYSTTLIGSSSSADGNTDCGIGLSQQPDPAGNLSPHIGIQDTAAGKEKAPGTQNGFELKPIACIESPLSPPLLLRVNEKHHTELRASGISDELIAAAGIYSASEQEVHSLLDWRSRDLSIGPGLVIPFAFPNEPDTSYCRIKPDTPRRDREGKIIKYESKKGSANRAYFPPGFFVAVTDPSRMIVITEGEKKALSTAQNGFACIGLVGVWGFAKKRARRETGTATGPRYLIDDLEKLDWSDRHVAIVFDSDAATNQDIQQAEQELAGILQGRGALVQVVRLPQLGEGKTGLDDFLVYHGTEGSKQLQELIDGTLPFNSPKSETTKGTTKKPPPMELADKFLSQLCAHPQGFTLRHWRDEFHQWNGCHYERIPTHDFEKHVLVWLDEQLDHVIPKLAADVTTCIAARALIPANHEQPLWLGTDGLNQLNTSSRLTMANGILDLDKLLAGQQDFVEQHTPLWFCSNSVPYSYDASAQSPQWFTFLKDVFDGDMERINLLAEWFGYCLTRETKYQAIMTLAGPRRSGKGTILRALRQVVGEHNCASPCLQTLSDAFGLSGLFGKTCAVCSDAHLGHGDKAIAILEILKLISGEDAVEINRKFLPLITSRLNIRFTLAVNELPKFGDSANALLPRLLILPFHNCYEGREDRDLESKLAPETAGIFNWAVWGLQQLRRNGRFTQPKASLEIIEDFKRLTSPIAAFVDDCCTIDPQATVAKDVLWQSWTAWCSNNGNHPSTREQFGSRLKTLVPGVTDKRPSGGSDKGPRPRLYAGIGLKETTAESVQAVQAVQVIPLSLPKVHHDE